MDNNEDKGVELEVKDLNQEEIKSWNELAPKEQLKRYFVTGLVLIAILLILSALLGAYVMQWSIAQDYNCTAIIS